MTDPLVVGRITYPPGERVIVAFGTLPDPRDACIAEQEFRYFKLEAELNDANARIAELEAALRAIRAFLAQYLYPAHSDLTVMAMVDKVLMPPPKSDMVITQEELDAV